MSNFIIDTNENLKQKMDLISNLIDIKIAYEVKNKSKKKKTL